MAELKIDLAQILREAGCSPAVLDVVRERIRQTTEEGWSPEHDDEHIGGQLAKAAVCYAKPSYRKSASPPQEWPWGEPWWKPKDQRSDLVRAAALLIAEIDRIDRRAHPAPGNSDG